MRRLTLALLLTVLLSRLALGGFLTSGVYPSSQASVWGTPQTIGTAYTPSNTNLSVTVTIPAANLIVICATTQGSGVLSVTDGASNTYTQTAVNTTGTVHAAQFFAYNSNALSSQNINLNISGGASQLAMSGLYISGALTGSSPYDSATIASAVGSSATPSVTSGTPGISNELMVACLGDRQTGFTQDSTDGWNSPPDFTNNTGTDMESAGGFLINTGSSPVTFAPTIGGSGSWVAIVSGFQK